MKFLALLAACLMIPFAASAQDDGTKPAADSVLYLMPHFGKGLIYFHNQAPAQGELNICAVDQTLRFKDKSGKEMVATNVDNLIKVIIDGVPFIRDDGAFFRIYPVDIETGVALKREVKIIKDLKTGAYGTETQTSSISEHSTFYADGVTYQITPGKTYPVKVNETLYLYKGNSVLPLNKKGLKKLYPQKKAEIDAFFKDGNSLPSEPADLPALIDLLTQWAKDAPAE